MKYQFKRILPAILLCLCLALSLASCSSSDEKGYATNDMAMGTETVKPSEPGFDNADLTVDSSQVAERKVIKTYQVNAETKAWDQAVKTLEQLIGDNGGYLESARVNNQSYHNRSDSYTRYASYTIRIPAEKADAFMTSVGNMMNITSNQSTVEDISETYYSMEARLEELKVERDALLDILNQDATKKDYSFWLTVKQRLSEVTQQIAVYQGQLNRYDGKVAYSTVHLELNEVLTYSSAQGEKGFWASLGEAFLEGWSGFFLFLQDFAIFVVGCMPVLLLLSGIALLIVFLVKRSKKKREQKRKTEIKAQAEARARAQAEFQNRMNQGNKEE